MRSTAAAFLALFVFATCDQPAHSLERSVVVNGHTYKYRVWLPPRFTKLRRWRWPVARGTHSFWSGS